MNILTVNLLFSTLVFWIAARIYVLPRLHELKPRTVLRPILILHSFRHLGLMFLAPRATYPDIPASFCISGGLRRPAGRRVTSRCDSSSGEAGTKRPIPHVGLKREGTLDLLAAIVLATVYDAAAYMGPAYWIPAYWVPALLVTHYITFIILRKHWSGWHARSADSRPSRSLGPLAADVGPLGGGLQGFRCGF